MGVVKSCHEEVGLDFDPSCIDRVHRVAKVFHNENGEKIQPILVKFRSWNDRVKFYKARPKFKNNSPKPGFTIAIDLTKRRYELLKFARGVIKDNVKVKYAFADINCSPGICLHDDKLCFFNSKDELSKILDRVSA